MLENPSTGSAEYVNLRQSKLLNEVFFLLRSSQLDSESFCSQPSMDIITLTTILLQYNPSSDLKEAPVDSRLGAGATRSHQVIGYR